MLESFNKALLTGMGLATLTKEKIEEFGKEFLEKSKMSKEEGEKFLKELKDQSCKARQTLEEKVQKIVTASLSTMNIASKEDIDRIEKKLNNLEKKLK